MIRPVEPKWVVVFSLHKISSVWMCTTPDHQFIVPTQPIVTSLWKNGQPCCRSKINRPHSEKIENHFFLLSKTIFSYVKPNMFIFEFHFCINHINCHDTSMRRFFEKYVFLFFAYLSYWFLTIKMADLCFKGK